jgi:hypothetical protein
MSRWVIVGLLLVIIGAAVASSCSYGPFPDRAASTVPPPATATSTTTIPAATTTTTVYVRTGLTRIEFQKYAATRFIEKQASRYEAGRLFDEIVDRCADIASLSGAAFEAATAEWKSTSYGTQVVITKVCPESGSWFGIPVASPRTPAG